MASQTGKQIMAIHILLNISRNKGNQTMKFDQLIENNMQNIFLSHTQNVVETLASLRPFFNEH